MALGLFSAGCSGNQSALDPAGVQADRISTLYWLTFWVSAVVYVLVLGAVAAAVVVRRLRPGESDHPLAHPPQAAELRLGAIVTGSVGVTVVVLFVILFADFVTGRRINALAAPDAMKVRIVGHQWWWEVHYDDVVPSQSVTTANELHLPVGKTVEVRLEARDVIHSFWVPNLHGKTDMIPGHHTRTYLRADREGEFWGQCAEFCGYQHANMRLAVVAEPEDRFNGWLAAQRQNAGEPTTDSQKRGRQVFLGSTCVMCHTIQGTPARATVGPDLTHVGGRPWIGAGARPNWRGHLAGWVADPQRVKPGVRMPPNPLQPEDLRAVLDYLESLK